MAEAPASSASAPALTQKSAPAPQGQPKREFSPPKAPTNQAEPAENPYKGTKHRVKIAQEESEVDYDELVRGYQRAQDSQRRYGEAQKLAMQAKAAQDRDQQIQSHLEKGDVSWLVDKMGPQKAREAFENYLITQLEYDSLPDSEKRSRSLEQENKKLKEDHEKQTRTQQEEAYRYTVQQAHSELDQEIGEALTDLGGKPTPRLVIRILDEIEARIATKDKRITAKEARTKAVAGIHQDIAEYLPMLPPEELLKVLPKSVLDAISKHQVEQVLGERQAKRYQPKTSQTTAKKASEPTTVNDWYANMDKKFSRKRG